MPELHLAQLSHLAGCMDADGQETVGARFLRRIYDGVSEFIDDLPPDEDVPSDAVDRVSEITDTAIPVGTHELWKVFVELGGYEQDLDELGYEYKSDETYRMPQTALYLIGTALGNSLVVKYRPVPCPTCGGTGFIEGIGNREIECHICGTSGKISRHLAQGGW